MTVLGKILVIINLVFSLVVGSLIILVFLARTNWKDAYDQMKSRYEVAQADTSVYKSERDDTRKKMDEAVKAASFKYDGLQDKFKAEQTKLATLEEKVRTEAKKNTGLDGGLAGTNAAVQAREAETQQLNTMLKESMKKNSDLSAELGNARREKTQVEIENRSLRTRNTEMVTKIQEISKELVRKSSPSSSGTAPGTITRNPPAENVEGLIKNVDPSGLVTITIGSDASLIAGHTLEVFRLNPLAASQSKYLGTIYIQAVRPNEAVGKPIGRMLGPVQVGDQVASKILGS